jgi:hypothetical protein
LVPIGLVGVPTYISGSSTRGMVRSAGDVRLTSEMM